MDYPLTLLKAGASPLSLVASLEVVKANLWLPPIKKEAPEF